MNVEKIRRRRDQIREYQYIERVPIEEIKIREVMEHEGIKVALEKKGFKTCKVGQTWGKAWSTAWFRMRFRVPKSFKGLPVVARIDTGGQACAYLKGVPIQGLDDNHKEIRLLDSARGGERYELVIEAGAQGSFGERRHPRLSMAEIASVDEDMRAYYWDFDALCEVLRVQPKESRRHANLLYEMNRSIDLLLRDGFGAEQVRSHAKEARAILRPLLESPAAASELTLSLIGHAHIDAAWLWPIQETVRKCSRTFSSVCKYMEEYPHYKYAQSQAALYDFTKRHYPKLYERIREYAKKKRWEVVVGMWVEPDMNMAGAESLVRQILLAKTFTREEFGYETDVLWLPDVFGYCAALPQVLKKAGIDYFSTIKLFWNEVNRPPYQSFWWEGIDGTRVLAHFPPNGDYNAVMTGEKFRITERQYSEKDRTNVALFPFGWGDGGGGPALEHLERSKRYGDLEGIPKTRMQFITDFFHQLEKESADLPAWRGELYLETHQGTYTTQAATKRNNRKSEILYRETEFLATIAHILQSARSLGEDTPSSRGAPMAKPSERRGDLTSGRDCHAPLRSARNDGGSGVARASTYPREQLNAGWRSILFNQFHDVLPGSSIGWVYREAEEDYERVREIANGILESSFQTLANSVNTAGEGTPVIVLNSLPWERKTRVTLGLRASERGRVVGPDGPVRTVSRGKNLEFEAEVPSMGYTTFHILPKTKPEKFGAAVTATKNKIENDRLRVRFDRHGLIRSIYDKASRREVVASGARANVFQRFQDRPVSFDAWNIDADALDTAVDITSLEDVSVLDLGPLAGGIRQVRRFGKSTIVQEIVLEAGSDLIQFDTTVDWHEDWQLLKVGFPVDVHTDFATFEIQFGHVRRPTHSNTSYDRARYETCAHKWVDLSEPDYGVALLNDCKYGHDVHENVIRLTLLKSSKEPDEEADMGMHQFSYALMPHAGDYREGGVIRRAYEYNVPVTAGIAEAGKGTLPPAASFLSVDRPNVMVEAVKVEEKGERIIIRVYECFGQRAEATITFAGDIARVTECDLLERNHQRVKAKKNSFSFELKPFEIKTFGLKVR